MKNQILISSFLIIFLFQSCNTTSGQSPAQSPMQNLVVKPAPQALAQAPAAKPVHVEPPTPPVLPSPTQAPSAEPLFHSPPRKAPKPAPPNVTEILDKAGGFSVFIRLLRNTDVINQIENQLNSSNSLTILAPTNGGFSSLKGGTLNSLTPEQKVQLLQFHILPSFISLQNFETLTNPVRTQASNTDDYPMNITTEGSFVNISTGIVNTTISGTVYADNQLAIYRVDSVLLPRGIFAPKVDSPSPSPVPAAEPVAAPLKPKKEASASATASSSLPSNSSAPALKPMPKSNSSSASGLISPVAALDESGAAGHMVSVGIAVSSAVGVMVLGQFL